MMKRVWLFFILLLSLRLAGQTDSVQYVQGFAFNEGIYLTYQDFLANTPLPKKNIIFNGDTSRLDFLKQVVTKNMIVTKDSTGNTLSYKTASIWGYSENKTVYIQWNLSFNRVTVIGSICHFAATITNYMYTGPGTYPTQQYGTPVESLQQYVIDAKTGTVYNFNSESIEFLLRNDVALLTEYQKLKRKQKKDQAFIYLRKYNEKHPLYFPK
jgi:hypothetical protein